MTSEQKNSIAGVLILEQYNKNQVIVSEGDQASSFYIIKEVLIKNLFDIITNEI